MTKTIDSFSKYWNTWGWFKLPTNTSSHSTTIKNGLKTVFLDIVESEWSTEYFHLFTQFLCALKSKQNFLLIYYLPIASNGRLKKFFIFQCEIFDYVCFLKIEHRIMCRMENLKNYWTLKLCIISLPNDSFKRNINLFKLNNVIL